MSGRSRACSVVTRARPPAVAGALQSFFPGGPPSTATGESQWSLPWRRTAAMDLYVKMNRFAAGQQLVFGTREGCSGRMTAGLHVPGLAGREHRYPQILRSAAPHISGEPLVDPRYRAPSLIVSPYRETPPPRLRVDINGRAGTVTSPLLPSE